jgi:hypothetical protein
VARSELSLNAAPVEVLERKSVVEIEPVAALSDMIERSETELFEGDDESFDERPSLVPTDAETSVNDKRGRVGGKGSSNGRRGRIGGGGSSNGKRGRVGGKGSSNGKRGRIGGGGSSNGKRGRVGGKGSSNGKRETEK